MLKARVQRDGKSQAYFHPSPASTLLLFLNAGFAAVYSSQAGHTVSPQVTPKRLTPNTSPHSPAVMPARCVAQLQDSITLTAQLLAWGIISISPIC